MNGPRFARLGRVLCLAGALIGAMGFCGWLFGLPFLTTLLPGQPKMMPNTSVALAFVGLSGALRYREDARRSQKLVALLAALLVLTIGAGTLAEYALGIDLGIDQLLFASHEGPYPGRMSPPTALALTLLASALVVFDVRPGARARPSEWLILVAGLIGLVALTGMLLGAARLYRLRGASVIGVSLPTGVSLFLTAIGLLLERPKAGFMRVAAAQGPGGVLLRRLMVPAIAGPVLLAFAVRQLYAAGWIGDISLAIAIVAITTTVIGLAMLMLTAAPLNQADAALRASEREQRFLARIGEIFGASLDSAETLGHVASASVEFMGDFVIVDLVEGDGLRRMKVAHADPAKAAVARALEGLPPDRHQPPVLHAAIETKQTKVLTAATDEINRAELPDDRARADVAAMRPASAMFVPLIARDQVIGVMTFVTSTPGREYTPSDVKLAEEVARRAALALENARLYRIAHDAIAERDEIMGIVAHDLRNPLSTIVMHASLARQRAGEPANAIEQAAKRMNRLIQDLLDVTQMDAGRLSLERNGVPVVQVVHDAVEAQRPLAASASLELRTELAPDLPDVWADRDRLLQVFENLIGNALKFSGSGGRITVGAAPGDGEAAFWVADTGPGIPAADVPHVFDRFWQARKTGRSGAGLGLAIVKGIVEAHGGHVWVESTPGEGSTFWFTMPQAHRAEEWRHDAAPHSPALGRAL